MRNVGAHCPTKRLSCCLPEICNSREPAIEAPAAHRNQSDGILAVCCSIGRATKPSACCGRSICAVRDSPAMKDPPSREPAQRRPGEDKAKSVPRLGLLYFQGNALLPASAAGTMEISSSSVGTILFP